MARTKRGRSGRYRHTQSHPVRNAAVGIVGTLAALTIIGACSEDEQPPVKLVELQESSGGIPLPTEINVGREGRTVVILEDGYDDADEGRQIMTQADFPCNEDEVLAYHPSFGPDHVGCLNREDVD